MLLIHLKHVRQLMLQERWPEAFKEWREISEFLKTARSSSMGNQTMVIFGECISLLMRGVCKKFDGVVGEKV